MKQRRKSIDSLLSRVDEDSDLRGRLLADPKAVIERELGVSLPADHEIHVHEESREATHLVLPPPREFSAAEREEAKNGLTSLDFLRRTMHDPAPPPRHFAGNGRTARNRAATSGALAAEGRESIRRGLDFVASTIDENGAWRCVRFNTADPDIPRHYEKPPFVSAYCVLALQSSGEARARAICAAAKAYLADTIEYPGLWRYYRHLPPDLDSIALCSLVIGTHPWILLERNVPRILANRDGEGRFLTWIHAEDEPDVAAPFRIEADPVVNANIIAYLGDHPETRQAQRWLEALIVEDRLAGSSKWYPDQVAIFHATARAISRARPALDRLRPLLAERILGLRDGNGEFGDILGTAQAVAALYNIGSLRRVNAKHLAQTIIGAQRADGSWPELLAFGDQFLKWGVAGRIGHGAEAVTSAFCIEALERLAPILAGR